MKKNRNLIYRAKAHQILELAMTCPLPYADRIVKEEKGKETSYDLQFGAHPVKLPGRSEPLYLVVVRGFGQEPMMLLTKSSTHKEPQKHMGNYRVLSNKMADRRDYPFHQTELPGGRYPSSHLSSSSEYDGDSHSCGLLCHGVSGIEDKIEGIIPACNGSCKKIVRCTGFSLLCPCRWYS